jgi:hypothetical protein
MLKKQNFFFAELLQKHFRFTKTKQKIITNISQYFVT